MEHPSSSQTARLIAITLALLALALIGFPTLASGRKAAPPAEQTSSAAGSDQNQICSETRQASVCHQCCNAGPDDAILLADCHSKCLALEATPLK